MGRTELTSNMKTPKLYIALGVLWIVNGIIAQGTTEPESEPPPTTEPEPETPTTEPESEPPSTTEPESEPGPTTTPPGEQPVAIIEPGEDCIQTKACLDEHHRRGICVNMKTAKITDLRKRFDMNKEAIPALCDKQYAGSDQNECCRCLKNKCKASKKCLKKGGICRVGGPGEKTIRKGGCKSKGKTTCGCYKAIVDSGP